MSTDYLPHKDIRKKIEGVTTETDTKYKTKTELIAYGKIDTSRITSYGSSDYVIDDDITIGYLTKEVKMTVQLDGYIVSDLNYVKVTVKPEDESSFDVTLTY